MKKASIIKGALVALTVLIASFSHLDMGTVNVMEARNFIAAREMAFGGSWLLPTMNGQLRIAKPPLPTWATAVFMRLKGTDENLACNRIPAAICGVMLAAFTFLLARRMTGSTDTALLSMLVLCTSYLFLISVRKNTWDIFSVTFMTGALWAVSGILCKRGSVVVNILAASLLMACAFMSKGPVPFGVMLVPFLAAFVMIFGLRPLRDNGGPLAVSAAVGAVLAGLWPLYVFINAPHAASLVASKETSGWFTRHTQPLWYYLLHLQEIVGVWVFFLLGGIYETFAAKKRRPSDRFFVVWFLLSIAIISLFPEKKLRYLLPLLVSASVVCALTMERLTEEETLSARIITGGFGVVTGLLFVAASLLPAYFEGFTPGTLLVTLPLAGLGIWLAVAGLRRPRPVMQWAGIAGICFAVLFLTPTLRTHLIGDEAEPFLHLRHEERFREVPFYSAGELPAEVIWASGRTITPLASPDIENIISTAGPFVLIVEGKTAPPRAGLTLVETIRSTDRIYRVYLHHRPF